MSLFDNERSLKPKLIKDLLPNISNLIFSEEVCYYQKLRGGRDVLILTNSPNVFLNQKSKHILLENLNHLTQKSDVNLFNDGIFVYIMFLPPSPLSPDTIVLTEVK